MRKLSVIIVNYHSSQEIINCLESAFKFPSASEIEWIVVNNESDEGDDLKIISAFPSIKWIEMGYNSGFSRANNRGIKESEGQAVLLLNPDTIILDDAIEKCYVKLIKSNYVAASVQLLNEDKTSQITGNYLMNGGLNHLLPLPYLGQFFRWFAFKLGTKKTHVKQASSEQLVDWINGAFLMVKRDAIEKAGLMDEDFFLYSEEPEWCSRLKKYGGLCVYGNLSTIHLQGEAVGKSVETSGKGYKEITGKRGLQLIVSQHLRIRKEFGVGWFLIHLIIFTIEIPSFFFFSFIENIFRLRNPFAEWDRCLSFTKNMMVLWKLTPQIIRNKSHLYKMM